MEFLPVHNQLAQFLSKQQEYNEEQQITAAVSAQFFYVK